MDHPTIDALLALPPDEGVRRHLGTCARCRVELRLGGGEPPPADSPPAHYALRRLVGRGGFGEVFEAEDRVTGDLVALKRLRRGSLRALTAFKREFRAVQGLAHPNLVQLLELEVDDAGAWLTMELVEGIDLLSWLDIEVSAEAAPTWSPDEAPAAGPALALPLPANRAARCCAAFRQLAEGLAALHAAGCLHRDLKPANVRVTPEGRVVLLDFGLIAELQEDGTGGPTLQAGTPRYMAPEQARGGLIGPPADWFAFGVMLHEVFAGQLPGRELGGGAHPLAADRAAVFRAQAPGTPEAVAMLVARLLAPDPGERPGPDEVSVVLGGHADRGGRAHAQVFVGRKRERAALAEAAERAWSGRPAVAVIVGPSGIGKTALAAQALRELQASHPDALVLRGRCYEHEHIAFKGLDEAIDRLATWLDGLPSDQARALLPSDAAALASMFPALDRGGGSEQPASVDPVVLRRRAQAALRELLAAIASTRPVVVFVDDLQWGDRDSAALMAAVLAPPDPPPVFVLGTCRSEEGSDGVLALLRRAVGFELVEVHLDALDEAACGELVQSLAGGDELLTGRLAAETGGSPYLLAELALDHAAGKPARSLGEIFGARLAGLLEPHRKAVAACAVSGRPLGTVLLAEAAELGPRARQRVAELCARRIIRSAPHGLEPYHDKIREEVLAGLAPAALRAAHAGVARALAGRPEVDLDRLGLHLEGAGDTAGAARTLARAAEGALLALAFGHAARVLRHCLALDATSVDAPGWQRRLAEALALDGRLRESADVLLDLEPRLADAEQRLRTRLLAFGHLVRNGDVERAESLLPGLLEAVGLPLPAKGLAGVLSVLWLLLRMRLSLVHPASPAPADDRAALRLELLMDLSQGLLLVDSIAATVCRTRAILLAQRLGDRRTLATAIAWRGSAEFMAGRRGAAKLFDQAQALVDPEDAAGRCAVHTAVALAHLHTGDPGPGLEHARLAVRQARRSTELPHERALACHFEVEALEQLGRFREAYETRDEYLDQARARGERLLEVMLRTGQLWWPELARDDVPAARASLARAEALGPDRPGSAAWLFIRLGRASIDLYCDAPADALTLLDQTWRDCPPWTVLTGSGTRLWLHLLAVGAASRVWLEQGDRRALRSFRRHGRALWPERGVQGAQARGIVRAVALLGRGRAVDAADTLAEVAEASAARGLLGGALHYQLAAASWRGDAPEHERLVSDLRERGMAQPDRTASLWLPLVAPTASTATR